MGYITYLNLSQVLRRKGGSRSLLYAEIKDGRFPPPLKLGLRRVGWPQHEIDALLEFYLLDKDQTELKNFVSKLQVSRRREVKNEQDL